jgi:glucan biosynthesis protein C
MPSLTRFLEQEPTLPRYALVLALACLMAWSAITTVLGYGMLHLTRSHPRLAYANEAVLPFYILHQPVILIIGSFIIPLTLPIALKYLLIALPAFAITLGLYEFGVRRVNVVRRVIGLKARAKAHTAGEMAAPGLSQG